MSLNKTTILIIVIAAAVAAAACAVVFLDDDDKGEGSNAPTDVQLSIYGNANGDRTLDSKDVDVINYVISLGGTTQDYPLCDANCDGNIDENDVTFVKNLIDTKSGKVNVLCLDKDGDSVAVQVDYPLNKVVTYTSNINADVLLCGGQDHVLAYNSADYSNFETALKSVEGIENLGGSGTKFAFESFVELDGREHVGALIIDSSKRNTIPDEDYSVIKAAGVPTLIFKTVTMAEQSSTVVTLGFLFGEDTHANAVRFAETCDPIQERIGSVVSNLSDSDRKNVVGIIMGYMLMDRESDYYITIKEAGAVPFSEVNSSFASKVSSGTSIKLTTTENVLSNYDRDIDYLISVRSIDCKSKDLSATIEITWDNYKKYFEDLGCYESYIYVNALLPAVAKVAYLVENIYPEKVPAGFGDSVFNSLVEICPYYLSGCTTDNTFTDVTYSDYMKIKNGSSEPEPVEPGNATGASEIANAFVASNPSTALTSDAQTIANRFLDNIKGSADTIGTWELADGATADSATVFTSFTSMGSAKTSNINIIRSQNAASAYALAVSTLLKDESYTLIDTTSINDVKLTAAYTNPSRGTATYVKFVMQYGSVIIDASTDYARLPTKANAESLALTFVTQLANAVKTDAFITTWTVGDGADGASAGIVQHYESSKGSKEKTVTVTKGDSSRFDTLFEGNQGTYSEISITFDNENVKCRVAVRTMGSAYMVKFVMAYDDVLIDGASQGIYLNKESDIDVKAILQAFADAIVTAPAA